MITGCWKRTQSNHSTPKLLKYHWWGLVIFLDFTSYSKLVRIPTKWKGESMYTLLEPAHNWRMIFMVLCFGQAHVLFLYLVLSSTYPSDIIKYLLKIKIAFVLPSFYNILILTSNLLKHNFISLKRTFIVLHQTPPERKISILEPNIRLSWSEV